MGIDNKIISNETNNTPKVPAINFEQLDESMEQLNFKCENCGLLFNTNEETENHIIQTHINVTTFSCEFCQLVFDQRENLETHKRNNHEIRTENNAEITYECSVCRNHFENFLALQSHFKIHHNEIPVKCEICSKEVGLHQIQSHIRDTHAANWVRESIKKQENDINKLEDLTNENFMKSYVT